jgi:hypothetical protein
MDDIVDNKATRGCLALTGFLAIAFATTASILVVLAGLGTIATTATVLCSGFTGLFGAVIGVWGVRGLMSKDRSGAEDAILRVAKRTGGGVQVSTVAAETHLSLREADRVLDELAREGVARLDIDEEGHEIYTFPGIEKAEIDDRGEVTFDQRDFNFDRSMRKAVKTAKYLIDKID